MQNHIMKIHKRLVLLVIIYQIICTGCSIDVPSPSGMMEEVQAQKKAIERQQQNQAEMQKSVTTGAADLVKADAVARKDWIGVQSQIEKSRNDLVTQQGSLLAEYDSLERERKALAKHRLTGSVAIAFLRELGPAVVCSLPLFLLLFLLLRSDRTFRDDPFPDVVMDHLQINLIRNLDRSVDFVKTAQPRVAARRLSDREQGVSHEHH